MKSVTPSQIAPLFVSRLNSFDSPKELNGIEMPGSAPSALRRPFDIPYDPFEEKLILIGDSFDPELKGLLIEPSKKTLKQEGTGWHTQESEGFKVILNIDNHFLFSLISSTSSYSSLLFELMEKATQEEIQVKLDEIEHIFLIHAGRGNHDKLEQLLLSKEASEREIKAYIPSSEVEEENSWRDISSPLS